MKHPSWERNISVMVRLVARLSSFGIFGASRLEMPLYPGHMMAKVKILKGNEAHSYSRKTFPQGKGQSAAMCFKDVDLQYTKSSGDYVQGSIWC